MPKDIVILLDGTSNEIKTNRTNVLRLYGTLQKSKQQVVYYDPGVGTFGSGNTLSRTLRKTSEVWGMMTGKGLDVNVKEAYRFLVDTYEISPEGARDRIHIFGFSRGAYSARVLAGFLHAFGLMEKRNLNLLDYAYRAYKRIGEAKGEDALAEIKLHDRILQPDRPPIRFLGLFDTVSSVVEFHNLMPRTRNAAYTVNNSSVQAVRHAVALHDRRTMFYPQLWPEGQTFHPEKGSDMGKLPQDTREVWFTGVHGDIGGGYPEEESGLAKLPLLWMIRHSRAAGLQYDDDLIDALVLGKDAGHCPPDPIGKLHNSMTLLWRPLEYTPRRKPARSNRASLFGWCLPRSEWRVVPEGARLHHSVLARHAAQGNPPPNMPRTYVEEPDPAE